MIDISLKNIAEISLSALKHNVITVRDGIGKKVKICAVVKANAYGHGVGLALLAERYVDCFAVALVEEGVALRLCGVNKPILVLLPTDEDGAERGVRYSLTFALDSMETLEILRRASVITGEKVSVHLKVDTGMHRFGFALSEVESVCKTLRNSGNIVVKGCFSHLYNPENTETADLQYERFLKAKKIVSKYFKGIIYHLSASGGILLGRRFDFDMVRPGLLLYGYKPFCCDGFDVKPILKIKAKRLYRRNIDEGDSFLYGDFSAGKNTCVDLVRVGYADGLPRADGCCVNNRCMDVSGIQCDGNEEFVTVFSDAAAVAGRIGTIPYEVLCKVTARSHIVYKDDL